MSHLAHAFQRQPALPKYIVHIFQRLQQKRLNLITGAGVSADAGIPMWHDLLTRLAECSDELATDVAFHKKAGLAPEYLGQIIYKRIQKYSRECEDTPERIPANHGWAEAIHKAIYRDVVDIETILQTHPYLRQLSKLMLGIPFSINFNFDDILSQALAWETSRRQIASSFSAEWRYPIVDRTEHVLIYHVNGLLPQISLKKRSPQLIFTETSFSDAIHRDDSACSDFLFLRFIQNTMLMIGCSLADASLKNFLRMNRDKRPASHHYMIYWIRSENALSSSQREDIFEANLELYNLFTIFLTSQELAEFIEILSLSERDFIDQIDSLGSDVRSHFHFYIVGPVAVGKSTLLENLRCFDTYEEWTRNPPPAMYKSFKHLSDEERRDVDNFIYAELKEKNRRLSKASVGYHFMDRGPLDLYAFSSDDDERREKTKKIRSVVCRTTPLLDAQIIFLSASGETLVNRNFSRGRKPSNSGDAAYLSNQECALRDTYKPTHIFNTEDSSAGEVARRIVRHVLSHEYSPTSLDSILSRYE
jgi:hypothetical protein